MATNEVLTRDVLELILDKKLKPLSTKIDSVIESIDFVEAKVSELHKRTNDVEYTTDHVLTENRLLKEEVVNSTHTVNGQKEEINELEQYIRRECLEISGIPLDKHEDTSSIVIKVRSLMGINVEKSDISVSHRLPSKSHLYSYASRQEGSSPAKSSPVCPERHSRSILLRGKTPRQQDNK